MIYMDQYVKPSVSDITYSMYIRTIKAYFLTHNIATIKMGELSTGRFVNYYNEMLTKKSLKTMSTVRGLCAHYLNELVNRDLIPYNYAKKAESYMDMNLADEYNLYYDKMEAERKKSFSEDDIGKFYYAYENNFSEYACVAVFLIETGLRPMEFACLPINAIDYYKKKINYKVEYVRKMYELKIYDRNNNFEKYMETPAFLCNREIMLSDYALDVCSRMQTKTEIYCKDNKYNLLFPSFRTGKPRSETAMDAGFTFLCDKFNIDRDVRPVSGGYKKGLTLNDLCNVNVIAPAKTIKRAQIYDELYIVEAMYKMSLHEKKILVAFLKKLINEEEDQDNKEK